MRVAVQGLERSSVGVHEVQVARVERSGREGSMVALKALLPPTVWFRWGEGMKPGLTSLLRYWVGWV